MNQYNSAPNPDAFHPEPGWEGRMTPADRDKIRVAELERRRDQRLDELLRLGQDPDGDQKFNFLLGQLSEATDRMFESDVAQDVGETFKPE